MTKQLFVLLMLFTSLSAQAKVLFEGYYRLEVKGIHSGYVAIRHSLDEKTNERVFSYYQYKKTGNEVAQAGVTTTSTADFKPLRYRSYEWNGKASIYYEGIFDAKELVITKYDGRNDRKIDSPVRKPILPITIFSSLVSQVNAKNVNDYKEGFHVAFNGLSEEAGQMDHGEFKVLRQSPSGNQMIFQVLALFMNEPFEYFTFRNGEIAATRSVTMDQNTYLVANRNEAVKDFGLQEESLKKIFGDVPYGVTNNPVGESSGKLNMKDAVKDFPLPTQAQRSPSSEKK